jgi:hypothetical protein
MGTKHSKDIELNNVSNKNEGNYVEYLKKICLQDNPLNFYNGKEFLTIVCIFGTVIYFYIYNNIANCWNVQKKILFNILILR